jgi:hypothetical protein
MLDRIFRVDSRKVEPGKLFPFPGCNPASFSCLFVHAVTETHCSLPILCLAWVPELFKQTDEILNDCLDGLIVQFKASDADFFNAYQTAHRVVSTGTRKTNSVTPTPVPTPA